MGQLKTTEKAYAGWRVLAKAVANSQRNRKLGPVASTFVSQISCPDDCPFFDSGCYAEYGLVARLTRSLNSASNGSDALAAAEAEAAEIDRLPGDRPLRLHVVGDCASAEAVRIVVAACERYQAKHGQPVWTYTHAWRHVPRPAWGTVSVLASCEHPQDAAAAMRRGYAAAIVVDEHPSEKRYLKNEVALLPCPYESRGVRCSDCLLCTRDDTLRKNQTVIAFAAHGGGKTRAIEVIDSRASASLGQAASARKRRPATRRPSPSRRLARRGRGEPLRQR